MATRAQKAPQHEPRDKAQDSTRAQLVRLPVSPDDHAIVRGLLDTERWAQAALYDRYAPVVERILRRLVGFDADLDVEDLLHDVFIRALSSIKRLDDPQALDKWMRTIAARTAYRAIRTKRVGRWLRFWEPTKMVAIQSPHVEPELVEAYRRTYTLLEGMPARLRVPFSLRFVEGMKLAEVAEVCEVSLATVKRRIARAKDRFERAARRDDVLRDWLEGNERWTS